jgi:hypothetical protein
MLIYGKIFASQLRMQLLRRMFSSFREKLIILLGVLGFYFLLFRGMYRKKIRKDIVFISFLAFHHYFMMKKLCEYFEIKFKIKYLYKYHKFKINSNLPQIYSYSCSALIKLL